MKRIQLGFFFLLLPFLSACQQCTLSLIDYERQLAKLSAFLPDPIYLSKLVVEDPFDNLQLKNSMPSLPGQIGADDLKKIVYYSAATNRYQFLIFTIQDDTLLITLVPQLIFERTHTGQQFGGQFLAHEYLLKPGMIFNEQFHHIAIKEIENAYKKKGFTDVHIYDRLFKNPDQGTIQVQLTLQKGSYVAEYIENSLANDSKIIFEGNNTFSSERLGKLLMLYGDAIDQLDSAPLIATIKNWYAAHGFAQAKIDAKKEDKKWRIIINEGDLKKQPLALPNTRLMEKSQPHLFGKTVLNKISQVSDDFIVREISYRSGAPFNTQEIASTHRKLSRLQIFDRIHLYPVQNPFNAQEYTMHLEVRDDEPRELRTRAGLSLQQMSKNFEFKNVQYSAGGTFLIKNPTNHADLFFVDADYTYGEQILSFNYQYPWIGSLPMDARFQVYAMQYLQPGLRYNHKNIYSFVQQGALMGLRFEDDSWNAQINYGLEWMETKLKNCDDYPLFCKELSRALNFSPLLLDQKIPYIFTEPSIIFDTLDDQLNPRVGTLTLCTAKAMIPCKHLQLNSSFLKILLDHAYFVPFKYAILAKRVRVGHIFFKHFAHIMPAERFYLGGANSIRSYETDLCPPLGAIFDEKDNTRYVPQGAQSMVNLNIELRIPAKRNLWFVLFQDLGALSNTKFADIKMRHILAGTGAGIRIQTPIGPLRFDFAFKWNRPDPAIAPYCWFLSFGNAF